MPVLCFIDRSKCKNRRKSNFTTVFFVVVGIGDKPDDKEFLLRRLSAAVVVVFR